MKLPEEILNSDTQEEVSNILSSISNKSWHPLGGGKANYGIIEIQASNSTTSIVELIANSFDAILQKNVPKNLENPPKSYNEAFSDYVNEDEESVHLVFDGEKNATNFGIYDTGNGQSRERFESTFLNLSAPGAAKNKKPYLQGQYGFGSSGCLQFARGERYKFIASSTPNQNGWTWSLIRKSKEYRHFEYLKIDDEIPFIEEEISFETEDGDIVKESYGTVLKVFDYELNYESAVTSHQNNSRLELEYFLSNPPLDIRVQDDRHGGRVRDLAGLENKISEYDEILKKKINGQIEFNGDIYPITTYVFKSRKEVKEMKEKGELSNEHGRSLILGTLQTKYSILYSVNGQLHGRDPKSTFKSETNLTKIANDTLVVVDLTPLTSSENTDVNEVLSPSRDRLQGKKQAEKLRNLVYQHLKNNETLKKQEEYQRSQVGVDNEEYDKDIVSHSIENILDESSSLNPTSFEDVDNSSEEIEVTVDEPRPEENTDYQEENPPSYIEYVDSFHSIDDFQIADEDELEVARNSTNTALFAIDASNDITDDSEYQLNPKPLGFIKSDSFSDGLYEVQIGYDKTLDFNDSSLQIKVLGPEGEILSKEISIRYVESEEEKDGKDEGDPETPETTSSKDRKENKSPPSPKINGLTTEEWTIEGYDEKGVVKLHPADNIGEFLIQIHTECDQYRKFLKSNNIKSSKRKKMLSRYKTGIATLSLSQYYKLKDTEVEDMLSEESEVTSIVEESMKGIVLSLLYNIITKDELERWSE